MSQTKSKEFWIPFVADLVTWLIVMVVYFLVGFELAVLNMLLFIMVRIDTGGL